MERLKGIVDWKRARSLRSWRAFGLLLSAFYATAGLAPVQAAPPSIAQMLSFHPKQEGVAVSTPAPQEQNACKVELVTGSKPGSNGWLLRDSAGLPLRRFFDSNGDKKVDVWSYYLDGVEVYRELDANLNEKVDQYRWLNAGGVKWGLDLNEDGKIDSWKTIAAEEVSQELFQALANRDPARFQALLITEAEVKGLGLPAPEAARIRQLQAKAAAKFQATLSKLPDCNAKAHWVRLETGLPQCLPAEQTGMSADLIKYARANILYEHGDKHDFLPIGELIQVGPVCWRLVDAPGDDAVPAQSPELQPLLEELNNIASPKNGDPGVNSEVVRYNLQRADLVQKIIAKVGAEQREMWTRQLAECLSAAVQSSAEKDKTASERLAQLERSVVKEQPGTALAAFIVFRRLQADYAVKLAAIQTPDFPKLQGQWLEQLAQFVQTYPKAEDAPDAIMQLGMVSEFVNKEIEAKNWYSRLVKEFPGHVQVAKAQGALRRLGIEGQTFELSATLPTGSFDIARLKGKLVIVYYWASWNHQCIGDLAQIKALLDKYAAKGLELVCVNLDNGPPEADGPRMKGPLPGVQLSNPSGLDSPLATYYGIFTLPQLFLVDKDGKTLSRSLQAGNLDEEIKKQLK